MTLFKQIPDGCFVLVALAVTLTARLFEVFLFSSLLQMYLYIWNLKVSFNALKGSQA